MKGLRIKTNKQLPSIIVQKTSYYLQDWVAQEQRKTDSADNNLCDGQKLTKPDTEIPSIKFIYIER